MDTMDLNDWHGMAYSTAYYENSKYNRETIFPKLNCDSNQLYYLITKIKIEMQKISPNN